MAVFAIGIVELLREFFSMPKYLVMLNDSIRQLVAQKQLEDRLEKLEAANEAARHALQNPSDMVARENAVKALWAATNR